MNKRILFLLLIIPLALTSSDILPAAKKIKITDDLELIKLTENTYIHVSYHDLSNSPHFPANGFIYINNGQAVIIDSTWETNSTRILINWIKDNLKVSISSIIVTHWHVDCMGGLEAAHLAGIKSYSHHLTRKTAKLNQLPVPKVGFEDSLVIKVGEKRVIAYYFGPGHTVDNIVVWVPDDKILFAGCMVKALNWKSMGFLGDAHLDKWPGTLEELLTKFPQTKIVIPGHGKHGDLRLIKHTLKLLKNKM